jgi:dihydrofolate synthase/folylpolyglutamate synthase
MPSEVPLAGYPAVQEYLFALKAGGIRFGIDRMRLLSARLGHPEKAVPCLHIAGTNGKGSVAAMLESILRASGKRVGLYTSPHLVRLGERVQVNRSQLTECEICDYARELQAVSDRLALEVGPDDRPSFFEFMTAMAFLQFSRKACDVSIIEVGLGGRLDATNVVEPLVCAVTSIGLDHCEMLGNTLEEIAAEKGGIIKPGRPVVLGRMPMEAEKVIRKIAAERGARVVSVRDTFGSDIGCYPTTNLEGDYQRWNAGTATLAARLLPPELRPTEHAIESGLRSVAWPGRWQRMDLGGRLVILDASHNEEGARVLDSNLSRLSKESGKKPILVVGILGASRAGPLLQTVCRHCSELHLVVPNQSRASSYEELEALVPDAFAGKVVRSEVSDLFPSAGVCSAGRPGDVIVVTGSIYLLGEILSRLEPERGAEEGRLQDF